MREIKFRAWDKSNKIILYTGFIINADGQVATITNDHDWDLVLMQYTGLKDKNGFEIYEMDIIKYFMGKIAIIKFGDYMVNGSDYYSNYTKAGFFCEYLNRETSGLTTEKNIEIIGNIYENPELLEDRT